MANSKPNKNALNILVIQLDQMTPLVLPAYGHNDVFFKKFGEGLVPFPPPAPASLRGGPKILKLLFLLVSGGHCSPKAEVVSSNLAG